jgi:hypothetical protein
MSDYLDQLHNMKLELLQEVIDYGTISDKSEAEYFCWIGALNTVMLTMLKIFAEKGPKEREIALHLLCQIEATQSMVIGKIKKD